MDRNRQYPSPRLVPQRMTMDQNRQNLPGRPGTNAIPVCRSEDPGRRLIVWYHKRYILFYAKYKTNSNLRFIKTLILNQIQFQFQNIYTLSISIYYIMALVFRIETEIVIDLK